MYEKIGIICAADSELAPFLPHIENIREHCSAMLKIYSGTLCGVPAAVLFSGVCRVNAAVAAQILICKFGADAIINAGTAGAVSASLNIFDTVIATETAYHDVADDILTEFHPWLKSVWFPADPSLLTLSKRAVSKIPHPVFFGRMVTGESFISNTGREYIENKFRPLTTDMETAAVAHVCYVNGVPFAAVRTVTDTPAESGAERFEENCAAAADISAAVTMALLREIKRFKEENC